jgi:polysaccharide export outer membrane protein
MTIRIRQILALCLTVMVDSAVLRAQSTNYIVGAQDVLGVTVWNQADLTGKFTVEVDGTFTFPFIGRVKVSGLTLRQVETELRDRLGEGYLKNPQVSVAIESYKSQRIFVVGEVRAPGAYPLGGNMTLMEALAQAGSTTSDAGDEAVIVRSSAARSYAEPAVSDIATNSEVVRVQLGELEAGLLSQNVRLRDGDTIFVRRAASVFVFGQVKSPGAYRIQRGSTVLQALSLAGGVTDRGSTSRIKIVRLVDGSKKEISAKVGDPVEPGDTLIIPARFF